jgi:hypothetical protein
MNTTSETTTETDATEVTVVTVRLNGILETRDAGEEDLREAGILGFQRETLEEGAKAAAAGLCVMCSTGGVRTVTRSTREVPHDFLGTLWRNRGASSCDACGADTVTLHVCIDCQEHGLDSAGHAEDGDCPCCGARGGADRIRDRADMDAVEASGAENAETHLSELVDNETGNRRNATLEDLHGLGVWDEGAINAMTTDARLELAGLPDDLDAKVAGRIWDIIQREWCGAYNRGANQVTAEARAELEGGAE